MTDGIRSDERRVDLLLACKAVHSKFPFQIGKTGCLMSCGAKKHREVYFKEKQRGSFNDLASHLAMFV